MINVVRVCGRCGARISSDATREICPACLLETGLSLFDGESVAGVVDSEPGDRFHAPHRKKAARSAKILSDFGQYELLEEIGRGGQGVVYRAHQKSLNRTVALKVIGLGPWTTEAHLKRFRREAEAAASLDHPGIVPIYEVGERNGQCYFSMKFVESGQLDEVVRREPIPIRRTVELIAKVARTVHYAHEHGILHRDIKPGNILLDRQGEPHLTDFGLARLVEAESTVTATLDVLGTPSYMAPEQAAGRTAKVSKAIDVYGLGAVLYQLLTGNPPFAGGTTYETIKLLLDSEPRQPRLLNPKIDRELSTICLKCLEKDPQRRYSSALALAEDLEHWLKHEPILARPSGFLTHGWKWVRRNPSTTVLVTLLVALAIGLSLTVWNRKPGVLIPKSVAVLPFENLSDDKENAYFAEGVQEEILTRLASIADLKVISRASTRRYQSKPGNLAKIAKQLGVANILEGSVQKLAGQVRVNVQLINTQTDSHLWADTYDRKLIDIFGVESDIAKQIAQSLQAKLTGSEQQALAVTPTNNPEAHDSYLRGLAFQGRSTYSNDGLEKATGFFERAVRLDPNFAVAWARLSRAYAVLYAIKEDPTERDAAKRALDSAQKLEPNSSETLLALGSYQNFVQGDYGAAKTTFEHVSEMSPGSSEAPYALARVARRAGHCDESVSYYERALNLDPRNVELLTNAVLAYAALRQFPAALKLCDRVLDVAPNDPDVIATKVSIYQAQGDLHEASALLSGINERTPNAVIFQKKLDQLQYERNYGEATRLLQARLAQFHFDSQGDWADVQGGLAVIQWLTGDTAGAKVTAEPVRNTYEQLYRNQSDNPGLAHTLSVLYALTGQNDLALKLAERAVMLKPRAKDAVAGPMYEEQLAVIQTMCGENDRAISTLRQLLQTAYPSLSYRPAPITPALLRLDPIWDPLRSDSVFQKLCEEKIDRSIAVLPFENLSGDSNNAYFAEGIQEEILTRLAKIADLKVIPRTSTSRYKSKPDDIADIAKQLGVANIVEGSVQKIADQVRVNVQLINAQADSHLWAESYDRKLTDFLGVESEIAKRIAESLQVKMSGREERALAVKPTNNPEAYDAYLRGLAFEGRSYFTSYSPDVVWEITGFYERAVQLDPNFAAAWARLSHQNALIYLNRYDAATAGRRDAAKRALEQVQKLEPDSSEALLALGYYQYDVLGDNAAARTTFERVQKMLPGSSEVLMALATLARREGHWDQSVGYLEQALTLDPRNVQLLTRGALTYANLRQFTAAVKLYNRALDITPNDPDVMATKASIYQAEGNLQEAARLLSGINEQIGNEATFKRKLNQLQYERNIGEAIRLLQARVAQSHYDAQVLKAGDQVTLAYLQHLAGDGAEAKATAEQARNALEQSYTEEPNAPGRSAGLSQVYALMGEKDLALRAAERAVMLLPRDKDPLTGPSWEENLAAVQTICGENARAVATLVQLLQTPYTGILYYPAPVTPALLRLDPMWDPLRSDPAFQKLCEERQP